MDAPFMTRNMFAAWMSEIIHYNTIGFFMLKRFGSKLDLLSVLSILSAWNSGWVTWSKRPNVNTFAELLSTLRPHVKYSANCRMAGGDACSGLWSSSFPVCTAISLDNRKKNVILMFVHKLRVFCFKSFSNPFLLSTLSPYHWKYPKNHKNSILLLLVFVFFFSWSTRSSTNNYGYFKYFCFLWNRWNSVPNTHKYDPFLTKSTWIQRIWKKKVQTSV